MLDFIVNEAIYILLLFLVGFIAAKLFKRRVKPRFLLAISIVTAVGYFLFTLTATLIGVNDIWYPFLIDVNSNFLSARHDYDVENLIVALFIIYILHVPLFVWSAAVIVKLFLK